MLGDGVKKKTNSGGSSSSFHLPWGQDFRKINIDVRISFKSPRFVKRLIKKPKTQHSGLKVPVMGVQVLIELGGRGLEPPFGHGQLEHGVGAPAPPQPSRSYLGSGGSQAAQQWLLKQPPWPLPSPCPQTVWALGRTCPHGLPGQAQPSSAAGALLSQG